MSKRVETPLDLFFDQLSDLHSMESQISHHLPNVIEMAREERLRSLLVAHQKETLQQLTVIKGLFASNGKDAPDDKCKAIAGLVEGGEAHLESVKDPFTRDLMVIAHCLRVENYEIAAYAITARLANQLEVRAEAYLLEKLLDQEVHTARDLGKLEPLIFENCVKRYEGPV